jgi:choice-of-anchor B domain-containing protein
LSLSVLLAAAVAAHDNGEAPHGGNPPLHAIDTMRAFQEDHHEIQDLSGLTGIPCVSGDAGGYPCSNVDLLAFMPLSEIGGGNGNDIWGWTDPQTGKEYAIMGRNNGTSFVDISDPVNPVYLGSLPPHSANSSWRDIKVYANHAYIVTEAVNSGLQVFDLTELRNVASPPETFAETSWHGGFLSAHNLAINEATGFAYAVGTNNGTCGQGLYFIDIRDPANPLAAGCFADDGYTHDAQCVLYHGPDTTYQGREICFNYNEDTLTIVDVTDKAAPVQLSRTDYVDRHYTHQGWLTDDHSYLLMDDELDERHVAAITNTRTYIWDISDLDAPVNMDFYEAAIGSIDHNQYIQGIYSYQANYQAGLRILDVSDIKNSSLTEVGYFDIYPGGDTTNFNGAWSNYPFFSSGIVVVSGIEQGLFILKPNIAPAFDADGDGIADATETLTADSDGDGTPDYQDTDSDNNGISDADEAGNPGAPFDLDNDGIFDFQDSDNDNDSVSDVVEIGGDANSPLDLDEDGSPDYLDTDIQAGGDIDGDGLVNVHDLLLLQRALIGSVTLDATQIQHADIYPDGGDGALEISDLMRLQYLVLAP